MALTGGVVALAASPASALAARARASSTGGSAAPAETPAATGGVTPNTPSSVASPLTGGAPANSEKAVATTAQLKVNSLAQTYANRLGWLASGASTGQTIRPTLVPAVGGGELAEVQRTITTTSRVDGGPGEYDFTVDWAVDAKGNPDYNRTEQVTLSEGPDDPTAFYGQVNFNNRSGDDWVFAGIYTGKYGTVTEAAAVPKAGTTEAQLTTAHLKKAYIQASKIAISASSSTSPLPTGYLYQAFPQPGNAEILDAPNG